MYHYHYHHHHHHHHHYHYILFEPTCTCTLKGSKQWMKMNNFRNIQMLLGSNNNCLFWGCYQSTLAVIPSQWHCKSGSDMFGIKSAPIWRIFAIIPASSKCKYMYILLFWNRPSQVLPSMPVGLTVHLALVPSKDRRRHLPTALVYI